MMKRNRLCPILSLLILVFALGLSLCMAAVNYQVWAGDEDLLEIPLAYYNVDEYGYVKLGEASAVATFHGDYQYYVVAVTNQLHLDAVQGSDGYFYGEKGDAHLATGNVTDWNNVIGPTNNQYAVLGGSGSENFTSYFRFTNPGTWTSITVYALDHLVYNPVLRVNASGRFVWSGGWPAWAAVDLTIGDPASPAVTAVVYADGDGNWWFDVDEYDYIRAGDVITADDGTHVPSMTVADLSVTGADSSANTLSGTGPAQAHIRVRVGEITVEAVSDNHGEWTADLGAEGVDIGEGTSGHVNFYDEHGHLTKIFWRYASLDVDEIAFIWSSRDHSHYFTMEIEGQGILGARFQAPSGEWYDLYPDVWELEWWQYVKEADDLASLDSEFEPGEYRVEFSHYHGVSTAIVTFAEMPKMPNAAPEITAPTFGQSDVSTPEAELEWASVADPNFNVILIGYSDEFGCADDEHGEVVFLEPGAPFPTSMTMTNLQPDCVYVSEVLFINAEFGDTTGDVETEFLIVRANPIAETVFSTNTDPDRFDPIEHVSLVEIIDEEDGQDLRFVFEFDAVFSAPVDSLYHEVLLRLPDGKKHRLHGPGISQEDADVLFKIEADSLDDLPGDGWYLLVLRPDPETAVCTPFWFGAADLVNPLPMPNQQPVITHPLPNETVESPVLVTWEGLTDADVNILVVVPDEDEDPVFLSNLEQTAYGPVDKEPGEDRVMLIFLHGLLEQDSPDGILFDVAKGRATLHSFMVGDPVQPGSYADWAQDIPEGERGYHDTPMGDNIPNLLKYASGLDAMTAYDLQDVMAIYTNAAPEVFAIRFYRSKLAIDAQVVPQQTSSLTDTPWTTDDIDEQKLGEEGDREKWEASIPLSDHGFMRLKAVPMD